MINDINISIDDTSLNLNTQTVSHVTSLRKSAIEFSNISYKIPIQSRCSFQQQPRQKRILTCVSGIMTSGLNAIMGPSGSGKTTLLDILAGRKKTEFLTGNILFNNQQLPQNFKRISGYITQEDIITGTLTVRENLWFYVNLRLPRTTSYELKKQKIEELLKDLGLNDCADTQIGTEVIRGISGGEKKRACIAIEMVTSPPVLFLDEPTTGLDASTANAFILLLKKVASKGCTVVVSIHQPRYSIFRLFDRLTFLSLGRLVYHGSYRNLLPYFETLGFYCEEHNNPADFILDVINEDSSAVAACNNLNDEVKNSVINEMTSDKDLKSKSFAEKLEYCFKKSNIYKDIKENLLESSLKKIPTTNNFFESFDKYAVSIPYQFFILLKRVSRNIFRDPKKFTANVIINILFGIIFGILYYQIDNSSSAGVQNRFGILFFFVTNTLFKTISSAESLIAEKEIFKHEYSSGHYSVIAYFMAKLIGDMIPLQSIGTVICCTIVYWMVGLKATVSAFFIFMFFCLMVAYAGMSITIFFAVTFSTFAVSTALINLIFVISILFSGLLLNLQGVLPWLSWIKYLSVTYYGFSGIAINEFQQSMFLQCSNSNTTSIPTFISDCGSFQLDKNNCYRISGECFVYDQLKLGSYSHLTYWDLWQNGISLLFICIGMLLLTFIQLMRTPTTK